MKEHIKNFFKFLNEKEKKHYPFLVRITYFPETLEEDDLVHDGKLMIGLSYHHIILPKGLTINGNLEKFGHDKIIQISENVKINGNAHLREINELILGDNITIMGHLVIDSIKNVNKLPNNLKVMGSLFMRNTNIEELPNDIYVGQHLFIQGSLLARKHNLRDIKKQYSNNIHGTITKK